MVLEYFLNSYIKERPLFLSILRAKEAYLYQKYLPLKKPILDVGCGDGFFAKIAFERKSKIKNVPYIIDIGLDIEGSRIDEAREANIYKKLVIYDGKKISYPNNYFSTIISNSVLEHVLDLQNVLQEIHRVLRPKGIFLTTVMAKEWEENLCGTKLFGDFYKKWMRKKQVHVNLLSLEEWNKYFLLAGFNIYKEIGYVTPRACCWLDILHYVSIPSLVTYKIFGRWVLFPEIIDYICPKKYLTEVISPNVGPEKAGALFYVLSK